MVSKHMTQSKTKLIPWYYKFIFVISFIDVIIAFSYSLYFVITYSSWPSYQPGKDMYKSVEISWHAVAAIVWIFLFITQITLGGYSNGGANRVIAKFHRFLGYTLLFIMLAGVLPASLWVGIVNPNGLSLPTIFSAVAVLFFAVIAQVTSVIAIRSGRVLTHVDAALMIFVAMTSVATIRIITLIGYLTTENGFSDITTTILFWLVVYLKCILPVYCADRIRNSRFLIVILLAFLPIGIAVCVINAHQLDRPITIFEPLEDAGTGKAIAQ